VKNLAVFTKPFWHPSMETPQHMVGGAGLAAATSRQLKAEAAMPYRLADLAAAGRLARRDVFRGDGLRCHEFEGRQNVG
jgi:hypothetical protein